MNWILLIFITIALFGVPGVVSLKCYQCISASLDPCPEEDLKNCSASQAVDSCSIRIQKELDGNLVVRRHCILGPCELRDSKAGKVINFGNNCDLNSKTVDCVACCKSDGCNKNNQVSNAPSSLITLIIVFQLSSSSTVPTNFAPSFFSY